MHSTKTFKIYLSVILASLLLAACAATRPQLASKSAIVPAGVDLSGRWQLRVEPGSRPQLPRDQEPAIRIPPATSSRNSRQQTAQRPRGSGGSAVSVFLETGKSLKITQTVSGLFISFDRSVVEEYRFGENRLVSVGPIEAQRVSGWQDGRFVSQTLDDSGAILNESWELLADGQVLLRKISLTEGDKQKFSSEQHFDRS